MSAVIDLEEWIQEAELSFDDGDSKSGINFCRHAASVYADQRKHQLAGLALATLALGLSDDHDSLAAYQEVAPECKRLSASDSSVVAHHEVQEVRALAREARRCGSEIVPLPATESGSIRP